jgi:protein-tyrosine-phosphatase
MRILFICSGNICRSPMAAELMRDLVAKQGMTNVEIDSAGTLGIEGAPASVEAIEAAREVGIDLTRHRSQGLRASHLQASDIVVAMTGDHLVELAARFPDGEDERVLIRAFERGPEIDPAARDLDDPIGHPVDFYRAQVPLIRKCLDHLARFVRKRQDAAGT